MDRIHGGPSAGRTAPRGTLPRRATTGVIAALLVGGAIVALPAQPALAGPTTFIRPISATYTDSRQPTAALPSENRVTPVGSWLAGGERHTSRAYFTFDLGPYQGKRIVQALASTGESTVNDCGEQREVELWQTDTPATPPTWASAPAARMKIADLAADAPCPASHLEAALTDAVRQAVTAGQQKITLMLRVGDRHESQVAYGRRMDDLGISLQYNTTPTTPTRLDVSGIACTDAGIWIGTRTPSFDALIDDPDNRPVVLPDTVTATAALWPVDRPGERVEWSGQATTLTPRTERLQLPAGTQLTEGETYAFTMRASDGVDTSPWSAECRFTIDTKVPPAPVVTSTDYPADGAAHGGPGIPGSFTLTANGGVDVVGYLYGLTTPPTKYVAADQLGGSATVSLAPTSYGTQILYVQAVDRTKNRSVQTYYEFRVRQTAPVVRDGNPTGFLGEPRELTFQPGMANVVEYTYRLNDNPEQTVAAAADGTVQVTLIPDRTGGNTVYVRSRTADNLPSDETYYTFYPASMPSVSSVEYPIDTGTGAPAGTPGTFVFHPGMPGVTEYVYSIGGGDEQTVAAKPDGTASVTFTPEFADYYSITVRSRTASGLTSESFYGGFLAE